MNWLSFLSVARHYPNNPSTKMKELINRWDHKPSSEELDILRKNLQSYLSCIDDTDNRDYRGLIEGILAEPEFLNRAIIVSDGSYLALRVYAYTVNGKIRVLLCTSYDEAKFDSRVREYLWDRKHSVEDTLEWILKNYQTIPFQCGSLSELVEWEQSCKEMH